MSLRAACLALAIGSVALPTVTARANPAARSPRLTRPVRASPPPSVPVQIAGLRPGGDRTWASVLHAIRRDALPWLNYCYTTLSPRGVSRVVLSPSDANPNRWTVSEITVPGNNSALKDCVRRAAARVVVPPSEVVPVVASSDPGGVLSAPTAPDTVSFEIIFSLPRLGQR